MRAPLVVYTDLDGGDDPTEGMGLLRADGSEVAYAQSRVPDVIAAAARDAEALLAAVESGHLAGAVLGVFTPEPLPTSHPLLVHPRVITTPHVGFLSDTTDAEYVRQAAAVVSWRANGRPDRAVNRVEVRL
jgi:D-3-phosphoglycerate dehydrogenase